MDPMIMVFGGVAIVLLFVLGSFMACLYQKVGPNTALIVSGGGGRPKIIVGGGTIVLPLVNRMDLLSLELVLIELKSNTPMMSANGVPLFVEGVAQIKIRGDEQSIQTAAEQFLGKDTDKIQRLAQQTLMGHLRSIVGSLSVEELIGDFDVFASRVAEVAITDLAKMGLTIVSFTIKEVSDNVGYLEALGKKSTDKLVGTASLIGRIAVVSEAITSETAGQITYENGSPPKTLKARTRMLDHTIPVETAVIIQSNENDVVFVEPWSKICAPEDAAVSSYRSIGR